MYRYVYWFKRRTPQKYKPVILITGCGSGVGLAIAELFYGMPMYRVVVTAREHSLELLKSKFQVSERFKIESMDVCSLPSQSVVVDRVIQDWGTIDILINNAGISYRSVVEHMSDEEERHQMSVNYFGPMALIRLVIPFMRAKGRGKIINVSSVSGMLAMPTMASYSASKYALEGASEALWYEMRPFGIDVSLIQPGFIRSSSFKNVYYSKKKKELKGQPDPYQEYYDNMTPFVEKLMGWSKTPPEKVARLVLDVVLTVRPPLWIPATIDAEFFYYLRRVFPRRLLHPFLFRSLPGIATWGVRDSRRRKNSFAKFLSHITGSKSNND